MRGRFAAARESASERRAPRAPAFVWLATGAVGVLGAAVYVRAYRLHHMQPVGWDIFSYIWQTAAVGHGSLADVGARPGVPLLASLIGSVLPLSPTRELVVLPIVLAAVLALASAATVRMALRLRPWVVPVLVAAVLLWPGTGRTLAGYEASLLLLVLLAAGVGILVQANGRLDRLIVAAALFLAAALTHLAIFAAFALVMALFVLLSVPAFVRDRRSGVRLRATDAGGAAASMAAAAAAGAGALFGALGLRPGQAVHTEAVSFLFRQRTFDELRRIRPWASLPTAAVGAAATWAGVLPAANASGDPAGSRRGLDRHGRALTRLGFAWLAVAGGGVLLAIRGYSVPGGRLLLFALPLPVLVGLGLAAVGWIVSAGRPGVRALLAAALIAGILAGLARPGYRFIQYQYVQTRVALTNELGAASSYVGALPGAPPVVVVVDQPGPLGAYSPKLRQNVIRTAMPADEIASTIVFVGRPEDLLAGRPTLLPPDTRWQRAYNQTSRLAWAQVMPALASGAVVLVLQKYNPDGYARLAARDPARVAADGVYVLRGPARSVATPARPGSFGSVAASLWGLWILVVLTAMGWEFARTALPRSRASTLDVACMAPAVGAGAGVLVAFAIAVLGGDPSGPWGVAALIAVAAAGLALRLLRRRPGPNGPDAGEPPSVESMSPAPSDVRSVSAAGEILPRT